MAKKLLALMFIFILVLSVSACSTADDPEDNAVRVIEPEPFRDPPEEKEEILFWPDGESEDSDMDIVAIERGNNYDDATEEPVAPNEEEEPAPAS